MDYFLLLTPVVVAIVLVLFRFVGCGASISGGSTNDEYDVEVLRDEPISYWRLQEPPGSTTAADAAGLVNGTYGTAPSPLSAGPPAVRSTAVNPTVVQVGLTDLPLLLNKPAGEPSETSVRLHGGFVQVPFRGPLNPPEFTLEAVVFPEWDLSNLGKFYCVVESSSPKLADPSLIKKLGYAIYGGPDNPNDPASPYHWQVWVGTGDGFVRWTEKTPYAVPVNDKGEPNPGPAVVPLPTYLAVTYDGATATLFMYTEDRDFDFVKYELNMVPYSAAGLADLFIGISGPSRRALFSPPGPNQFLYPFHGRMAELAVYDKAVSEDRVVSHIGSAFHR